MFSPYFLQVEMSGIFALIIIVLIIIILAVVLLSRRKEKPIDNTGIGLLQQQIDAMKNEYGEKINSIPAMDVIQDLEGRMEGINEYVIDSHEKDSRERIEKLTEIKDEMEKDMKERIVAQAKKVISESSVSREEFKDIERRLDKFVGDDTQEEKVELLSKLFNSQKISVISWKCKMIHLLRNGVAPQIDEGKFVLNGIPIGEAKKFLKELAGGDIVDKREIDSYAICEEYLWMEQYVDKPVWLRDEFDKRDLKAKKEKEYQNWMKYNLDKIEVGLLKENREVRMKEGTIDFLCRDSNGKLVGLELKFPKATQRDAKQLIGYAEGIEKHEQEENFRGIMVAPKIPDGLKHLLEEHELEYKEVLWNDEENNPEEEKNYDVDRTIVSENENNHVNEYLVDVLPKGFEEVEPSKSSRGTLPKGF